MYYGAFAFHYIEGECINGSNYDENTTGSCDG